MTSRERRLSRLLELRTQQQDAAGVELRAAARLLDVADSRLRQCTQQGRDAHENMAHTLAHQDRQGWLLACADAELSGLRSNRESRGRANALTNLQAATVREADARRHRSQMEATFERASKTAETLRARAEQQQMDEVARLVRAALSSQLNLGRFR